MKKCKVCGGKYVAKGFCRKHYFQMYKHGKILKRTSRDPNNIKILKDKCAMELYNRYNKVVAITYFDKEDLAKVKQYKWALHPSNYVVYKRVKETIYLHRLIMGTAPKDKPEIDHINRNPLDNRKKNLRHVNKSENRKNCTRPIVYKQTNYLKQAIRSNNKTGVTGIHWDTSKSKWVAQIMKKGTVYYLGAFSNFDKAVKTRKEAEFNFLSR